MAMHAALATYLKEWRNESLYVRTALEERLKKLERSESVIVEHLKTMRGTPVIEGHESLSNLSPIC